MSKSHCFSMFLVLLVLVVVVGCSVTPPETVAYDVVSVTDVSFAGIKRYVVRARVDNVLTAAQLESTGKSILKEVTQTNSVDALTIFFYLRDSDVESVFTAGEAQWVAYGEWARAYDVRSGDHSHNEWVTFPPIT